MLFYKLYGFTFHIAVCGSSLIPFCAYEEVEVTVHLHPPPQKIPLLWNHLLKRPPFSYWIIQVPLWQIHWPSVCESISGFSVLSNRSVCLSLHQQLQCKLELTILKLKHRTEHRSTVSISLQYFPYSRKQNIEGEVRILLKHLNPGILWMRAIAKIRDSRLGQIILWVLLFLSNPWNISTYNTLG